MDLMQCGYPRFFIHKTIDRLATTIVDKYGVPNEKAILFPSFATANRCVDFFHLYAPSLPTDLVRILQFVPNTSKADHDSKTVLPKLYAVLYPKEHWPIAKQVWQHTGDGISSRRGEFCEKSLLDGSMVLKSSSTEGPRMHKGPRRYQKRTSVDIQDRPGIHNGGNGLVEGGDPSLFVEERFGRNLSVTFAAHAKLAIRRRIAGSLSSALDLHEALAAPEKVENVRGNGDFSVDDVYLYPTGMSSIFNTHRIIKSTRGEIKSISYGFPYVDTLKILEKWGPGVTFYGHGSTEELDDLEKRLESGEKYLALFCEFPGNPLLKSPDLLRIRALADKYDFAVVVDETIGNFMNIHVLPHADVVVSSLTKIFSGDSNVMGGSAILNPKGRYYQALKQAMQTEYEDNVFEEDAVFLERNSRDFISRIARVNQNAETICDILLAHPRVKQVNYPKHSPSRKHYEACRLPNGGYGGLLSCTFHALDDAKIFYDHLDTAKGPSLGTNFTLASPYVILAHYTELDWAASFGCEASLVRFSVGLEETEALKAVFRRALDAIPQ